MACHILQVELVHGDEGFQQVVDAFRMGYEDALACKDAAMAEIARRAAQAAPEGAAPRLTYQDDEGDWCTLSVNTFPDALLFTKPVGTHSDVSALRVRVEGPLRDQAKGESSAAAEEPKPDEMWQGKALEELNRMARDTDLRLLVPRLAGAALRVVEEVQYPALFPLLDVLSALRDGQLEAINVPQVLPEVVAAVTQMSPEEVAVVIGKFKQEAEKEVATLKEEQATRDSKEVEVHLDVRCDGCGQHPVIGCCYKSLQDSQLDLCKACFDSRNADPAAWVCVQSQTTGTVVGSFYAEPSAQTVHNGVQCDGCDLYPIVGRRFKCLDLDDYDLCASCHERAQAATPNRRFQEVPTISVSGAALKAFEACEAQAKADEPQRQVAKEETRDMVSLLGAASLQAALGALLQHSNEAVRAAAVAAVQAASNADAEMLSEAQSEPDPAPQLGKEPTAAPAAPPSAVLPASTSEPLGDEAPMQVEPGAAAAVAREALPEELPGPAPVPEEPGQVAGSAGFAPPPRVPSALVLGSGPMVLGVEAQEDRDACRDTTEESKELLSAVGLRQAFRIGRVVLPTATSGSVPALAKVIVVNNSQVPWPETAAVTCVMGDALGFPSLPLGAVQPGEAAEIAMDLLVPCGEEPGVACSAWALVSSPTGTPLGPLLLLEVLRVQA